MVSKVCSSCGKKGPDLLKCSVCKSVWYCNVQCQKKDWKSHKQCCGKSGEAENGHDTGEGQSSSLTLSTTEDLVSKVCSCCGKKGLDSLKCSVCNSVWYCNVQCQKKDWKSHKQCCGKSGEAENGQDTGEGHSSSLTLSTMEDLVSKVCSSCGKKGSDLIKCSVCKSVWYCNIQCQKKDWKSHKQCCGKGGEAQKGQDTGDGHSSSSCEACESCGKTGEKLLKCGTCISVRYCSAACQKGDWENHKKYCRVVKVYPDVYLSPSGTSTNMMFDHIKGKVTKHQTLHRDIGNRDIGNFVTTKMDMIVKIQTTVDFSIRPNLMVYNESRDYYVIIKGHDRYYDSINDKVLLEGLPCFHKHPRLRKLYVKAHLYSDSSLDVHLNCTYNIQNW